MNSNPEASLRPSAPGVFTPNQEQRDYDLSSGCALAGLLDTYLYPPYVREISHVHNCMEIGICISGTGTIELENTEWEFSPGAIIVAPAGVHHRTLCNDDDISHWRYVLVNEQALLADIPAKYLTSIRNMLKEISNGYFMPPGSGTNDIWETIDMMFQIYYARSSYDVVELFSLLCILLFMLSNIPNPVLSGLGRQTEPHAAIDPSLQYITENYTQEIRISDLAAACAMSESYFRKTFTRIMGMAPLEYVNRYRINMSFNLLRYTDETILSIAGKIGFPSIATFNRNFVRYVGIPPKEWRKNPPR